MLFCHLLIVFKMNSFEKKHFRNTIRASTVRILIRPDFMSDMGPKCLQKLSTDYTSWEGVKEWQRMVSRLLLSCQPRVTVTSCFVYNC